PVRAVKVMMNTLVPTAVPLNQNKKFPRDLKSLVEDSAFPLWGLFSLYLQKGSFYYCPYDT
ncbi:hypothetical protein, partial [Ruminococcus sp.]|uniref:hypothetical protein n=1 Tax=Ruminococcus sp. TaxID=41978 RepID=UPI003AF8086D